MASLARCPRSGYPAGSCSSPTFSPHWRAWRAAPKGLKLGEGTGGVAEARGANAHAVHDRQVEAAQLAFFVVAADIVEYPAGPERAAQAADQDQRHLARVVAAARPHVREEHEA